MSVDHTDRSFDPRQRIVGAIILVSLAIIFVPMILDEQPALGSAVARLNEIPAPEQKLPAATAITLSVPAMTTATQKAVHAPETAAPAIPTSARPEKGAHRTPTAERAPGPAKDAALKEVLDKGWFVQVGTFSNADNARQLADKLKQNGFVTRTDNVQLTRGRAVRVRVGPFPENGDAKTAQNRIEQAVGVKGVVLAYQ